jgi:type VI secretion system protein ImpM
MRARTAGFYGKIPSRGDFVRSGLPRGFIDPWDRWMQQAMAASRIVLGDEWTAAWLQAAIWSFALAPGLCGPDAVIGVFLPSVDRIGRHFPLTVAAVAPGAQVQDLVRDGGGFLAAAEQAGLAAVESDIAPDDLAARVDAAIEAAAADPGIDAALYPQARALWWTEGAPLVPRGAFTGDALPEADAFVRMLDARDRISTA